MTGVPTTVEGACLFLDPVALLWRWLVSGRFVVDDVRERLRGRRLAFVGDSLARNQFQSAVCMLAAGLPNGTVTNVSRRIASIAWVGSSVQLYFWAGAGPKGTWSLTSHGRVPSRGRGRCVGKGMPWVWSLRRNPGCRLG